MIQFAIALQRDSSSQYNITLSQRSSSGATGQSDAGIYDPYIFVIAFIIAAGIG